LELNRLGALDGNGSEGLAGPNQHGFQFGNIGHALDDHVAVVRVELDAVAAPPGLVRGDQPT
jgi:hypothetical protein